MATYYWVGGTGNWDATTTTNWATSSGGTGGAGVPTSADDVVFDGNSNLGLNTFTVSIAGTSAAPSVCRNFSTGGSGGALDAVMTLTLGATAYLGCYGSLTFPATNLATAGTDGSQIRFLSTSTGNVITTNGVLVNNIDFYFEGIGGQWSLGSAITGNAGTSIIITSGTFSTNNFNITAGAISSNNSNIRTINLGSSTITLNTSSPWTFTTTTNLTFNAGTSTLSMSAVSSWDGAGLTYYNVIFTSTSVGTVTVSGQNTFNNLTITSVATTGVRLLSFFADQTINGVLTLGAANTPIRRMRCSGGATALTQRTITVNGSVAALNDVDFQKIIAAGTAGTWSGTRLGNLGGNSNITTSTPKTVYWNLAGTQNWSATAWATTNNGTPDVNNFPLAQDTAVFTEAGAAGTITLDGTYALPSINMADGVSNRVSAMTLTLATTTTNFLYGNLTLFSGLTLTTSTGSLLVAPGTIDIVINTAGKTLPYPILISSNTATGKVTLASQVTSNNAITLDVGTLDLNNQALTGTTFSSNNSNTRTLAFGSSGTISLTGGAATVWQVATATNFTVTGTPSVFITNALSTGTRTLVHGSLVGASESNVVSFTITAGSSTNQLKLEGSAKNLIFAGTVTAINLTNDTRTIYGDLVLTSAVTMTAGSLTTTFAKSSGIQTFTSGGRTIDFPIAKTAAGTLQFLNNCTIGATRTLTLTAGTLDVSGVTLTCGLVSSSNTNSRSIAFGPTGSIVLSASGTIWNFAQADNLTISGTSNVSASNSSLTINHGSTSGGTEQNAISLVVNGGGGSHSVGGHFKDLTLGGASFYVATVKTIYGNFTSSGSATFTSSTNATTFAATSGTQTITPNGKTFDFPVEINAPGATVALAGALTMGSTRLLTLTAGTFSSTASNYAVTIGGFLSTGTETRSIEMFGSNWTITGSTWDVSSSIGVSAGTSTLSFSSASAKTMAGASKTYHNLVNSGAGQLSITSAATFNTISNSVQPTSFKFPSDETITVSNWNVSGTTATNKVTVGATSTGRAFVSKASGTVTSNFLDLNSNVVRGGATWYAVNCVDSGNNGGWSSRPQQQFLMG